MTTENGLQSKTCLTLLRTEPKRRQFNTALSLAMASLHFYLGSLFIFHRTANRPGSGGTAKEMLTHVQLQETRSYL